MSGAVLVTGSTGYLGRHLLDALRAAGVPAIAHLRQPAKRPDWMAGLALEGGDVLDPAWASQPASSDIRTIVHSAGIVQHSRKDPSEMMRFNVESAGAVVRRAAAIGARVVLVSSSGVVGCFRRPGVEADEDSPDVEAVIGRWPYYMSKLRAERKAQKLAAELGVELSIVRLPVLLGPDDHRFRSTSHVTRALVGHVPFIPSGGIGFVDVRDVASAITRLTQRERPRSVYHLPGATMSLARFFAMVEEISHVPVPRRTARPWLLDGLAAVTRRVPVAGLPDPVLLEMASHHWGITSLWSAAELGHVPRSPRQTVADTIAWLRQNHPSLVEPAAAAA